MRMLSRFDVIIAKELPVQQVARQKVTASDAQLPAFFQFFLLEHCEDLHPNYSLFGMKHEEVPGEKKVEPIKRQQVN